MRLAVMGHAWQRGFPPAGQVVEVWYLVSIILATWNGNEWRTADGQRLEGVSYWRFRQ
jgi:hypothetical protein